MPADVDPSPPESRLDNLARRRPDLVLMAPMLVYLLLLGLKSALGVDNHWISALIRGFGGLLPVWLFWNWQPAWGRPHVALAAGCGLVAAAGWYYGQYFFNWLGVPATLPLPMFDALKVEDPRDLLAEENGFWARLWGLEFVFWLDVVTRISVACITVPIVEELFWRAFLLRALIDWDDFERIPLGTPNRRANILSALLSTIQHPYNWAVSIPCWLLFNGLMYWKKSILFMILVHAFTNFFLYAWVIYNAVGRGHRQDWMFW